MRSEYGGTRDRATWIRTQKQNYRKGFATSEYCTWKTQESSWIFARHVFADGLTVFEAGEVYQQESWMKRQLILLWTHASVATPCESNFLFFQLFRLAWPAWFSTRGDPNSYDVKIMKEVLIHTQTCVCSNVNISIGLSNNYAWYLERLQEVGFINELKQSLAAFQRCALQSDVRQYRSILINIFLKRIVQLLPTWSIPFTDPFFQRLLQVSIKFYIERHVEAN
jgi:hypothetical protein